MKTKTMEIMVCECGSSEFTNIHHVYSYEHQVDPDLELQCSKCKKIHKI